MKRMWPILAKEWDDKRLYYIPDYINVLESEFLIKLLKENWIAITHMPLLMNNSVVSRFVTFQKIKT